MTDTEHTPAHPIVLNVLDADTDHFIVSFDRPGRIEVGLVVGDRGLRVLAHGYDGSAIDVDQSPLFAYDGTLGPDGNQDVSC